MQDKQGNGLATLIEYVFSDLLPRYTSVNEYISQQGVVNSIDFTEVVRQFQGILETTKELKSKASDLHQDNDRSYNLLMSFSISFEDLIRHEIDINQKLCIKSRGGKYGVLKYRKDSKQRDQARKLALLHLNLLETLNY